MQLNRLVGQLAEIDSTAMLPGSSAGCEEASDILGRFFSNSDFADFSIPTDVGLRRGCFRQGDQIVIFFHVTNGSCRKLRMTYQIKEKGSPALCSVEVAEQESGLRPKNKSDLGEIIKQLAGFE